MTTATMPALTPFQSLLLSRLPADCPAKSLQSSALIGKSRVNKILRHGVMPDDLNARSISEGLNIPWAALVDAARASCQGRPLPAWALRHGETPGHWRGYDRPTNRPAGHFDNRAISAPRWRAILADIHPGPRCFVDPAQLLRDWQAFGATDEQVAHGARVLGVTL